MKLLYSFLWVLFSLSCLRAQPVSALIVTGGHSYDTLAFVEMVKSFPGMDIDFLNQPEANRFIAGGLALKYDLLIFYDMWREISENEKEGYINLTRKGIPLLFLHHSLVSYQHWKEFEEMIGGRYVENVKEDEKNQSTYRHDTWVSISSANQYHPITKGLGGFELFDEVYGNVRISENVVPLLETKHPESSPIIGWENSFNLSKIVYLQPGHGKQSFQSPEFRKLVFQTIGFLTKSN